MKNYNPNKQSGFFWIIAGFICLALFCGGIAYSQANGKADAWGQHAADNVTFNIFSK